MNPPFFVASWCLRPSSPDPSVTHYPPFLPSVVYFPPQPSAVRTFMLLPAALTFVADSLLSLTTTKPGSCLSNWHLTPPPHKEARKGPFLLDRVGLGSFSLSSLSFSGLNPSFLTNSTFSSYYFPVLSLLAISPTLPPISALLLQAFLAVSVSVCLHPDKRCG